MITILMSYVACALTLGALQLINRNQIVCRSLVALFMALQVALTYYVMTNGACANTTPASDAFFTFDSLASIMTLVVTIISAAAFSHTRRYIEEGEREKDSLVRAQYNGAMTILTMALTMAGLSNHIAVTWIFVEITTLSASALIFYRRSAASIEATWKYVFACSISLVLVYVGILLMSISMGYFAEEGLSFSVLTERASTLDSFWLKMSFLFVLVGYTAKMGLVPMFTAGIDAKDMAPNPAAAMLSSVVMNAGFVGFFRVYKVISLTSASEWAQMVVLGTGLISIFVAAVYLIKVQNVKRLFAYSSVEHIGVVMLGIAAGGVGVYAAVLHLVLHAFAKSAIFLHVGQLYRVYGTKQLSRMGRYINHTGSGAAFVILALLCITAMPPSGLFMTELMVFKSLIDAQWLWVLGIAMILLCVIVWAISRDMLSLLFLPAKDTEVRKPLDTPEPIWETLWQFSLIGISIWWGLATPNWLSDLLMSIAK